MRYLLVYDGIDLSSKNSLVTYQIPTGDAHESLPNYYKGLSQSRLDVDGARGPAGRINALFCYDF